MLLHWLCAALQRLTTAETLTEQVCPALWPIASLALWRFNLQSVINSRPWCVSGWLGWSSPLTCSDQHSTAQHSSALKSEPWMCFSFTKWLFTFTLGSKKRWPGLVLLCFCPVFDLSLRITSWHCGWSKPCLAKERRPANTRAVCSVVSVGEKALLTMQINIFLNVCCKVA